MKQFYATIFCSLLIVPCFAQQLPAAPAQQPDLQSLIPIQKGDSFYLRPTLPPGKNQTIVTNAIRAVGAGLATYGTAHALATDQETGKTGSAQRSYLLPAVGAGIALSARPLTHITKHPHAYLQYTLYDKHLTPLSSGIFPLPKSGTHTPILLSGQASQDGYLSAQVVSADPKTAAKYQAPVVSITPAQSVDEATLTHSIQTTYTPTELVDKPEAGPGRLPSLSPVSTIHTAPIVTAPINTSAPALISLAPQIHRTETRPQPVAPQSLTSQVNTPAPVQEAPTHPLQHPTQPDQNPSTPIFHKGLVARPKDEEPTDEEDEEPTTDDVIGQPDVIVPPPFKGNTADDDAPSDDSDDDDDDDDGGEEDDDDDDDDDNDDDDGSGGDDDDGTIYDQVTEADAADYFDSIDTTTGEAFITNYDGEGGSVTYTYDNTTGVWSISSWTGDFDPTSAADAPATMTPAQAASQMASTTDGDTNGSQGIIVTQIGAGATGAAEDVEYVYNGATNLWDIDLGVIQDPNSDAVGVTLLPQTDPTDPAFDYNDTDPGAEVKTLIQDGNYIGAVNLIISTYGFVTTNSTFTILMDVQTDQFSTTGPYGGQQLVTIPEYELALFATGQISFGALVRAIGHEYQHVQQRTQTNPITNAAQEEVLAYIWSLTAPDSTYPPLDNYTKQQWKGNLTFYYSQLSSALQAQYASAYEAAMNS